MSNVSQINALGAVLSKGILKEITDASGKAKE